MRCASVAAAFLAIAGSAYAQITAGSGSLTDASGNLWVITPSGSIQENGQWTPGGGGTSSLLISNGTVYGEDASSRGWFALSAKDQAWISTTAPVAATSSSSSVSAASPEAAVSPVPCPKAPSTAGTSAFRVANGQIVDPTGSVFIARGINVFDTQMGDAAQILATFPGVNFIRLNVYSYQPPSTYQAFINTMTAHRTIVELEDHQTSEHSNAGGGSGAVFAGALLASELGWYRTTAAAYLENPYVWFGTNNEPSEVPSAAALSVWQQQTYQAIRDAGNNSPILVEMNCDANACGAGYMPSVYAAMTNIVWDMHFYDWLAGYSADQPTIAAALKANGAAAQQIPSADGVVPVLIGEYGNSTDGATLDAGGIETVAAVINSGATGQFGSAAWGWRPGAADLLVDERGTITAPFGQQVQLFMNTSPVSPSACQAKEQATNAVAVIQQTLNQQAVSTPSVMTASASPTPTAPAGQEAAQRDVAQADAIIAHVRAVLQGDIGGGAAQ